MTDQSLIALAKKYCGTYAVGHSGMHEFSFNDEHLKAFAAALTREQEAQPADDALREDIQPINTGARKPAVVGDRAAQPAAQEPAESWPPLDVAGWEYGMDGAQQWVPCGDAAVERLKATGYLVRRREPEQPAAQEPSRPKEIYATSANTESVRKGYEMGGYLKNRDELDAWDASRPPSAQEPIYESIRDAASAVFEAHQAQEPSTEHHPKSSIHAGCGTIAPKLSTTHHEQRAEPQGLREDLLMLQSFVDSVIGEFPDIGDIDGFALQDIAESCGLLVKESKTVPCGDNCACAEVVDEGRTTDCMRVQPVLQRARRASALAARASAGKEAP